MHPYDLFYEPQTPTEDADYTQGRRDAWESHHLMGDTVVQLEDRYEWIVDPRVSDYTAAYCAGYRSQIQDAHAADFFDQVLSEDAR